MERYNEYKDSGIEWIGEIPSHWEVIPLKYNLSLKARIGWNGLKSEEFKDLSYAYLVTGQDFKSKIVDWSKCYQISQDRYEEDPFIQLENGDLLVTKDGTIGKVAKVKELDKPACLNSGIFVIKQIKKVFIQDYLYWFLSSNQLNEFVGFNNTGTTIQHLYQNVFENMPIAIPSLSEQQAIADYLDKKCAEIDKAIAQQQKMIELLNERKQIIISDAVTKGLDKTVTMKDSGVEWIGEIPSHWKTMPLKRILNIQNGFDYKENQVSEGGYPVIGSGGQFARTSKYLYDGEAVLLGRKGTINKPLYSQGKIWVVDTMFYGIPLKNVCCKYIYYQSTLIPFDRYSTKTAIPSMTQTDLNNHIMCLPLFLEQQAIASYLDKKCEEIDKAIEQQQRMIDLLQERKKIIINDVVTGKVKVS